MRIAVIGAGIGGLVAAVGLQRDGHEVTVYERRSTMDALGAGLTLFGNAFEALDAIGLGDPVRSVSCNTIASMRAGQRAPSGKWLLTAPASTFSTMRSIHRADLQEVLLEALTPGSLQLGYSATVPADGSPAISLSAAGQFGTEQGSHSERYDLVIAADGIRSHNRQQLGLDTGLHYSGFSAWRGITERPVDLHGEAGETWGRGQLFGVVPLNDGRIYWFGTLKTVAGTEFLSEHEAALRSFHGWHAPIQECISATPPEQVLRHDLYDLAKPLASFTKGGTVLLGDAAHAMTPNLGQGAGQGIEDAASLVLLLRDCPAEGLSNALNRYSDTRVKRTTTLWRSSRTTGRIAQASKPLAVALRNTALRLAPGAVMGAMTRRLEHWPQP